jgi:hypothetical protein
MKLLLISVLLFTMVAVVPASGQQDTLTVNVQDYGVQPDTRLNIEPVIRRILKEKQEGTPLKIIFPKGRYDFWPHHAEEELFKASIAFDLKDRSNICIDGQGATFIFHGRMMPFRLLNSTNITLKNFSIDWDRPFISQAEMVASGPDFVDMKIDEHAYPYEIVHDTIYFIGEGWRSKITPNYNNIYNNGDKEIVYQTRDNPLGEIWKATVTEIGKGQVRFHFKPAYQPAPGTFIALYHGAYITDGILIVDSKQANLEHITIYHTLSCGVHGYKSEDIRLKQVNIIVNDKKGRVFGTVADATHFNGCKGTIIVDNCTITGSGDDCLNVHGMYGKIIQVLDDHSVLLKPDGRYIGFAAGETAWPVDSLTMQRGAALKVLAQQPVSQNGQLIGYQISFAENVRQFMRVGDLLENRDRNPDVIIKDSKFLKRNRARGLLITTAGKVLIENNYFNTAGTAILMDGDTDLWFESGAVKHVSIINNVFENCYTSGNNILEAPWGWGEGVITITPSVRPKDENSLAYHHNIRIENNTFKHYDYALLYARSVDSLTFIGNRMIPTHAYQPFYRKVNLYLDGCRNVRTGNNVYEPGFPGKNLFIKNMRVKEVKQTGGEKLSILKNDPAKQIEKRLDDI